MLPRVSLAAKRLPRDRRQPFEKAKPMMLRFPLSLALFLGFGALAAQAASPAAPAPDVLEVVMDHAKIAKVPAGVATLIIGNPIVADVTMLKGSGVMVVTGKGFGETNLLALDAKGEVLDEKTVRVTPNKAIVVVQRGSTRESYSCNPVCMPSVQLGDDTKAFEATTQQISSHNNLAAGSSAGGLTPH